MVCITCGGPIPEEMIRKHAVHCSWACRKRRLRERFAIANPTSGLPTSTVGALREMVVSADLLMRGFCVFRSVSPSCHCDLIAMMGEHLIRVEVRTAGRRLDGITWSCHGSNHADLLALCTDDGIRYARCTTGKVVVGPDDGIDPIALIPESTRSMSSA